MCLTLTELRNPEEVNKYISLLVLLYLSVNEETRSTLFSHDCLSPWNDCLSLLGMIVAVYFISQLHIHYE